MSKTAKIILSTTKGRRCGTIDEIVAWQASEQGAWETVEACGVRADVSHVEWGLGGEREAILSALCSEIDGMDVVTVGLSDEDSDAGRVIDVVDGERGVVMVAWSGGVRTPCDVMTLSAECGCVCGSPTTRAR